MMSDPIADAAAQPTDAAPSSTEPVQAPEVAPAGELQESSAASITSATPEPSSADSPNADASTSPDGAATPATTGNVLVNSTSTVDAPVIDAPAPAVEPVAEAVEPLPRESHLMLLEAKFAAALAKLRNGERVFIDELDAIYTHVKAVI
jgi:hypothetical protein